MLGVGKDIPSQPGLNSDSTCTWKNGYFLRHQKLTSPKYSTKHFFSQVSQGNKAYVITMYFLCPAPPASFESLGINRSRELPKTWILTALSLGLAPPEASKTIRSAVSNSQLARRHSASSRPSRARRESSVARGHGGSSGTSPPQCWRTWGNHTYSWGEGWRRERNR